MDAREKTMKFWEAMKLASEGISVKRKTWSHIFMIEKGVSQQFSQISMVADDWEIVEEPKKKVKRWLWASRPLNDGSQFGWTMLASLFYSDEEIIGFNSDREYIKLLWSETEFDE